MKKNKKQPEAQPQPATTPRTRTISPESAQRKVWKLEIRDLEASKRKVTKDWKAEDKRLLKEAEDAVGRHNKHRTLRSHEKFNKDVDRRIEILKGRLGI